MSPQSFSHLQATSLICQTCVPISKSSQVIAVTNPYVRVLLGNLFMIFLGLIKTNTQLFSKCLTLFI